MHEESYLETHISASALTPIPVADPGTPEWYAARMSGIGGSEAAAVAGLSEWRTPLDVYMEKTGQLAPQEDNDAMRLGRLLEPVIVSEFQHRTGWPIKIAPCGMLRHPVHEFILGTPDGIVVPDDDEGLECKATTWRQASKLGEEGSDDLPAEWICQVQQYMAILELRVFHIAVLLDGRTLRHFQVERNDELIDGLIEAERELWGRIQNNDPPEPNWSHPRTPQLVRELFRSVDEGKVIDLSPDACAAWEARQKCQAEIKRLQAESESFKALVLYELGDAASGIMEDGKAAVRRKEITRKEYVVAESTYIDVRQVKGPKRADVRAVRIPEEHILLGLDAMSQALLELGGKLYGRSESSHSLYFIFDDGHRVRLSDHEPNKQTAGWMQSAEVISVLVDGPRFDARKTIAAVKDQLSN